MTNNKLT